MKKFYCNGKKDFCDRDHLRDCDLCENMDGTGGEEREVDERQKLIDLLIAREKIKDANAYDRAESLADYLLKNGYRRQTEGK